jgi:dipeptidyl aminopeptidase/acylaminoacyl peptidase
VFCVIPSATPAQELAPIPVLEMLGARIFAEYMPFDLSPDTKRVAYTLQENRRLEAGPVRSYFTQTGASRFGNGGDIWITKLESGSSRTVTNGKGNNWSPAWSPDGRRVAFYSDRDGLAKVWIWDSNNDTLRAASDVVVRTAGNAIQWTPDGKYVLAKALPEGITLEEADAPAVSERRQLEGVENSGVSVYRSPEHESEPHTIRSDGWNLNYTQADLVLLNVETGKLLKIASRQRISQYWLSPDGTHVAFTKGVGFASAGSQQILYDVAVYSLRRQETWVVAPNVQLDFDGSTVSWSPDSTLIAFRTSGMDAKGDCFVVAASGGEPRKLTTLLSAKFVTTGLQPPLWDAAGRHIYFTGADTLWSTSIAFGTTTEVGKIDGHGVEPIAVRPGQLWTQEGGRFTIVTTFDRETKRAGFYKMDLTTGESQKLREENKSFSHPVKYCFAVAKNGRHLLYLSQDTQHGGDLWLSDADFQEPKQLTHINAPLENYVMGEGRVISWRDLDGQLLHGALLLPSGYQEGRSYPLIVKVYGGSTLSNSVNRFGMQRDLAENLQLFATRGYAVLLPDAPLHLGTPMIDLMKTVLPGVDKVIEMGIADPGRLGIMGHSYGGYSTLCLISETPRFKAAMMSGGFGNLISIYGQMASDGSTYGLPVLEKGQGLMGGSPWEYRDRYLENSPTFHLDEVKTPLLIVHGAADGEVGGAAPFLADEVFVGLRRLGKVVEYAKYRQEDHWPGDWAYQDQIDYAVRVLAWFDKYLKPKEPEQNPFYPGYPIARTKIGLSCEY